LSLIESIPRSCPQQKLVDFCTSKGIVVTAYSPLGSDKSPLLTNPTVVSLAEKHGVSPANVLISLQANRPNVNGKNQMLFAPAIAKELTRF
jgi:glycerol 2-dehydrogenase (NADP+)